MLYVVQGEVSGNQGCGTSRCIKQVTRAVVQVDVLRQIGRALVQAEVSLRQVTRAVVQADVLSR